MERTALIGARLPTWTPAPAVARVLEFDVKLQAPRVEPEVVKPVERPHAVVTKTRAPARRAPKAGPSLLASPVGTISVPVGPPLPPGVPFVELGGGGGSPPAVGEGLRVATLPDAEPRLREEVRLEYPAEARDAEVDGEVELLVTIDVNGRVVAVKVLRGPGYGLDEAAVSAIQASRWEPGVRGGAPARLTVRYVYRFVLQ
ncbi:MAG: TonB family protein [Archangium sp.]|nr:TonB family protein [Archangium sp.]